MIIGTAVVSMLIAVLLIQYSSRQQEAITEVQQARDTLEQKVHERSSQLQQQAAQLQRSNQELIAARRAAEEANHLKTRFLTNMSHELRTPLNVIFNFSDFVSHAGPVNVRQQQFLGKVQSSADHLLKLINDILDLARLEAGKMSLQREDTDLLALLRNVHDTAQIYVQDKDVPLRLEAPEKLPILFLDVTCIRQVLLNLLSNAAKFTKDGSIMLQARLSETEVSISIIDTGIGIPPAHQARIFEPFQQVQDDLTREYQGTGLGLPISKRLVELHGGSLTLASLEGIGTNFTVSLPLLEQVPELVTL